MAIAVDLVINASESAQTLGQLKKSIKDIQSAMLAVGDESSPEFIKLAKAAANAKDRIEEVNKSITAADPDKFGNLGRIMSGAAAATQLVTGAMALFGEQSEETQKALLKVQAAMQFAQGLQGIDDIKKGFQSLFKVIMANPIMALVAALAALAIAGYEVYKQYQEVNSESHKLNVELEKQKKITSELSDETDRQIKLLEAQGGNETEIYNLKKKVIAQKLHEAEIAVMAHEQKLREIQDNDSLWESTLKLYSATLKKLGMDQQADAIDKLIWQNKRERGEEDLKALDEEKKKIKDLENEKEIVEIKFTSFQAEQANKRKETKDKEEKEDRERDELRKKRLLEDGNMTADGYLIPITNAQNKATEMVVQTLETHTLKAETAFQASMRRMQTYASNLTKMNAKFGLDSASSLAGSLSELSKKHAKASKTFAIGQALINTYQGVTKALADPTIPSTVARFLAAASVLASGLVQVRNITQTNVESPSEGASASVGGISGGGGIDALNTQPQGSQQPAGLIDADGRVHPENQQQQPIQAFMVESQATHVMNQVAMTESAVRFH